MMNTPHIPAPRNETWGFWGTMNNRANIAWPLAMASISKATHQPLEAVRSFLDSTHGRHFAHEVQNALFLGKTLPDAIYIATQQWMGWKIEPQASKDYGIPCGLPYLTGFVIHAEITEEGLTA